MSDTLLVGYITAGATLIAAIITAGVALIQNRKLIRKNKEYEQKFEQRASTGVAIGYYYNFIENIYKIIDENPKITLEIYNSTTINEKKEFDCDKVRIEILMPRSLEGSSFNQATQTLTQYKKGDIVRNGNKRNYGINFTIQDDNTLVVVDVPTPLFALEKYLKSLPEFGSYIDPKTNQLIAKSDSEEYRARQSKEIENFKTTVLNFIENNRYAINKVHFRHLT
ncbi:hypothetical protein CLV58_1572 [Spirosoma oryzae]|uniref:Prokaryotic STING domain-containing protein n=1 Tax=Spirosoma oryzae TaxID=1469603 RepID=A0A2T0RHP1_9BACT|nr:STING domain-containing protein [Spirosoma oryzae]PRY20620.1 hypothetical protein CLV58_1572 [Spirosoma oryzae]